MKRMAAVGLLVLAALLAPSCSKKAAAAAGRIIAPVDTVDSGAVVTPKAVVHNLGQATESFSVLFRIGTSYADTQNVADLAENDSTTVSFKNWTASPIGALAEKCSTMLANDGDASDNSTTDSVVVISGALADQGAVARLAKGDSDWFNNKPQYDTTHDTTIVRLSGDTTLLWWRSLQTYDPPVVSVTVNGDTAHVSSSQEHWGYIYSLIKTPDTTWQLWTRPLAETWHMNGIYLRTGAISDTARGWVLYAVSLGVGTNDSTTNTVQIDSLRIMSQTHPNLVISDPLNTYFPVESLLRFTSAEPCSLTLYTNTSDGNVFLHTFVGVWYVRAPFNNAGNGVYGAAWQTQVLPRPRFAIFDLLNHQTLYTPDYGYDSNGWFLPYRIKNQ